MALVEEPFVDLRVELRGGERDAAAAHLVEEGLRFGFAPLYNGYAEVWDAVEALREAREESGLDIELVGERPPTTGPGTRALIAPRFLDIHRISETHEHIGMIYFARVKAGTTTLAADEHHAIRWCGDAELDALEPPMSDAVKWYCRSALRELAQRA